MRRIQLFVPLFVLLLLLPATLFAYARPLHRKMTSSALKLAAQQNNFFDRLGISASSMFGPDSSDTAEFFAAEGSEHEDDYGRMLNHFFDPAHGTALKAPSYVCFTLGARADNWALDGLLNPWSIADARSWVRTAVVGPTPEQRSLGYRMLFTNLGHVVHLIQDMAQPEHTRNDQHLVGSLMPNGKSSPGSLYETWALHKLSENFPKETLPDAANYFVGTNVVKLPSYAAYFSSTDRKGLADLTNRNFVTQDTNYGDEATWWLLSGRCATFQEPKIAYARPRIENIPEKFFNEAAGPEESNVQEIVYSYDVYDAYKNVPVTDQYHTHHSSVDYEIHLVTQSDPLLGDDGIFSLSDHSYQSRAIILFPRAIEYSAGLIDRFFRGRVGATWSQNQDGTWNLTITNQSSEKIGKDARVTAVYKATPQYLNRITTEDTQVVFHDALAPYVQDFDGLEPGEAVTLSTASRKRVSSRIEAGFA
jgi:hypothetical protein